MVNEDKDAKTSILIIGQGCGNAFVNKMLIGIPCLSYFKSTATGRKTTPAMLLVQKLPESVIIQTR